jgi:DNA-binding NtrC family response regulator
MTDSAESPIASPARALIVLRETAEARRVASALEEDEIEAVLVADDVAGYNLLDTEQVDALVCEVRAPRIDGLRLLRVARMRNPDICAILIAEPSDLGLATQAMEEGAHDFQTRPINAEKVRAVVRRGLDTQRLVGEMHELARRLDRKFGFRNLIGNSAPIVRIFNRILQICGNDVPVLILGEPGTGRGLVASTIHHNSPRRNGPLVHLDCAGLASGFLQRDLFGVSAEEESEPRAGRITLAEGGTLILDRVESLPLDTQGRIVRILRDGAYEQQGGTRTLQADVRLLAISIPDLRDRAAQGSFRGDLYDQLRTVTLEMPALRHRRRDIPLLTDHFLAEANEETGKQIEGVKPAAMDRLVRYPWPGNVRELKTVVRGMVHTAVGSGPLDVADLPEEIRALSKDETTEIQVPVGISLAEVERMVIEANLSFTGGDRRETAKLLGIGLRTLQRRLAAYGIRNRRDEGQSPA